MDSRIIKKILKKECEQCGKSFEVRDTARLRVKRFCSRSCTSRFINTGRKRSEEFKKNLSEKLSGKKNPFYGRKHSEETKKKLSESNKGSYIDKYGEERAQLIKAKLSDAQTGTRNGFYGKKHSEESKELISRNHADVSGSNNPMYRNGQKITGEKNGSWKGGVSYIERPKEWNDELKTTIRKRDGFSCALCQKNGYDVHHIDYNKFNNCKANLITLCRSCHAKTNFNREIWKKILLEVMNEKQ